MAKVVTDDSNYKAIADSIRNNADAVYAEQLMMPRDMPTMIDELASYQRSEGHNEGYIEGVNSGYVDGYMDGQTKEYDRFWDAYQNNGNRTVYSIWVGGFAGSAWNDENFKPKYPIVPTDAGYLFRATGITDLTKEDIVLDFSKCTAFNYTFAYNGKRVKFPLIIDMSSATNTTSTFADYDGTDLSLVFSEKTVPTSNTFSNNKNLTDLTISGTIGKTGLNLQWSTKLSKASITSVVNALSDTTSGLTVTLSLTAVNTAFATSAGLADGSTSEEWATLAATKSNWTISLV